MLQTLPYEDWRDFFSKKLLSSNLFSLLKEESDLEIYGSLTGDRDTTIHVGYFSSMTLIFVHIFNPKTPGKNRQQEIEHFYKYEFDSEKQYGPPGLDFDETNIKGIGNYLDQGFNGNETLYYKKGKLIKSRLTTSYYPDSPGSTITYKFEKEFFLSRFWKKLFGAVDQFDEIRVVDLRTVFPGLKSS